jgi:hypothetical protein
VTPRRDGPPAARRLTVVLEEEACRLALGPYWEGASLRPNTREALERAAPSPGMPTCRIVTCTVAEAEDMLDYFEKGAEALATVGDGRAAVFLRAYDATRRALEAGAPGDVS